MSTKFTFNPFTGTLDLITATLTPSEITGGTPLTLAGFDSTGTLFSPPGLEFIDNATTSYSIQINPNWATTLTDIQPIKIESNLNGQAANNFNGVAIVTGFGGGAVTSINNIVPFGFYGNFGGNLTSGTVFAFHDAGRTIDGSAINDYYSFHASVSIDTASMNTYRGFISQALVGNNTATAISGWGSLVIADTFAQFASINNSRDIDIAPNYQPGSQVLGYTAINTNPQFDGVVGLNAFRGIELGSNFGNTTATAVDNHIDYQSHPNYQSGTSLNQYTGLSIGPSFRVGSTLQNAQAINYNMDLSGTITGNIGGINGNNNIGNGGAATSIDNYNDANFNPNFGPDATINNYSGLVIRPNVQTGASITNSVTMMNLGINAPIPVGGNATGINVNMDNFTTAQMPYGLTIQNGGTQLQANFDTGIYPVQSGGGPYGLNNIGGQFHIAAGFPITGGNFGIGNNLGVAIFAEDDIPPDSSGLGLGFVMNGFLTQIGAATGKTVASATFMGAGAQNAYPGAGTFTEINMFRAIGILPGSGAVISNLYGFKVDPIFTLASPANAWGVWVGDTNADNYFAKDVVIGGATGKPSNADVALEIAGLKAILNPQLTTTQRDALTPLAGMSIYNTTTSLMEFYNGASWSAGGTAGANTTLSNLTSPTAINQDLIPDADTTRSLGVSGTTWLRTHSFFLNANQIYDPSGAGANINMGSIVLRDATNADSLQWDTRQLIDATGNQVLNWTGPDVDLNTHKLTGVVDPTSAQDAATKNYIDTKVIAITNGGTGQTTAQDGLDALLPSQGGNAGRYLQSDGTHSHWATAGTVSSVAASVPAGSILSVSGSPVTGSGTLAIATTGVSGAIPFFSSTSQMNSSALLTANAVMIGGGAATAPTTLASLGTSGQVLTSQGAGLPPQFSAPVLPNYTVLSKTGSYTLAYGDNIVEWNTSGGAATATLPSASGVSGLQLTIVLKVAGNALTIGTTGAQNIGALGTAVRIAFVDDFITVVSDGSNWILAANQITTYACYKGTSAASVSNNTELIVNFNTVEEDPLSLVLTGSNWQFIATYPGLYEVSATATLSVSALANWNQYLRVQTYTSGGSPVTSRTGQNINAITATAVTDMMTSVTTTVRLTAGGYLQALVFQNSGGARSLAAGVDGSYITIRRVGP